MIFIPAFSCRERGAAKIDAAAEITAAEIDRASATRHEQSEAFLQQRKGNIKVNLIGKSDLLCVNP
jgi:hypothetical protein